MNFFLRKDSVSSVAPRVATAVDYVKHSTDGFVYLATVLHKLLPQFGGPPLDLIKEVQPLQVINGEDLEDFHKHALHLRSRLELSKMMVPTNLLLEQYLELLNCTPSLAPLLSVYKRDLAKHKRTVGDHVSFHETIDDIYDYILESKCPTVLTGSPVSHVVTSADPSNFSIIPTANYGSLPRVICDLCDGTHDVDACHKRGLPFMPPSMAKKVLRYNEIHGFAPKVPKKDVIQTPSQPRHAKSTTVKPEAKMAECSVPVDSSATTVDNPSPTIEDSPTDDMSPPITADVTNHAITPAVHMAEFQSVDSEYVEYLFPSACSASIDVNKIPANYIAFLTPRACMGGKALPVLSSDTSHAEQDELFTHGILSNHTSSQVQFHADWGANIIIINNKDYFTEFVACEEYLNPINGVPVSGIKGFGTVFFQIGSRMIPVHEVAYMPQNPQNTMTSSHLQRLNGFLPGIHAMHSFVKLTNADGVTTKFIPTVKNGLDYIVV